MILSSPNVLTMSNSFEVSRIHTASILTKMVYLEAFWNGSMHLLVDNTMNI